MAITDEDLAFLLFQRLAAATAVSTLVESRIKPDELATGEKMPAIRYEVLSSDPHHHLQGAAGEAISRVQYDCYGATRLSANTVAAAVKDTLDGFSGVLGSVRIFSCVMDNQFDRRDPPPEGGKHSRPRRTLDFVIAHTEPVPATP